ncbi:hypothetical protein Leryth_026904 [Lithospermum erythrorhizon]|nr:hypothetical protein Leryth_026904 [Lithospermum erythrorhizon]
MSVHDDAVAAVVAQLTLAADGAFIGVALAYVAVRSLLKLRSTSSALRQIERAPSLHVSEGLLIRRVVLMLVQVLCQKKLDMDEIHDIHGLQLIVEKEEDCYKALQIVHQLWNEVPGRFKDYIVHPKLNGYRSLHTVVMGDGMVPLEVQIRTKEMHLQAEFGFAAHWRYKEVTPHVCLANSLLILKIALTLTYLTMSVQEFPANSTITDLLARVHGSCRWTPYGFPVKEDLRPRVNHTPVGDPTCKLKMGDVVELSLSLPDKSLTEYREEIQRMYNQGLPLSNAKAATRPRSLGLGELIGPNMICERAMKEKSVFRINRNSFRGPHHPKTIYHEPFVPYLSRFYTSPMSVHDDAVAAVVAQLTLAADGAFIGVALAYVAVRSLLKLRSTSSALRQIERAPSLHVSDLRSLLEIDDSQSSSCGKLVIVRGVVDSKSSVNGDWRSTVLVGHESGEKGVILQRTQTVPFVLADAGSWPHSKYVIVNMDGSRHPLPLVTVYHHFQPVSATPYTFLQALFGHQYPVGLVDEEKILPLGKEITAVGFCTLKSGTPEMKSSKDLPYFLSDLSKDQMILDLAFKTKLFLWTGVVLGVVAVGVLSYATMRNWTKWKEWRQRRQARQHDATESDDPDAQIVTDDDNGEVPDGELCVICLTRRRRSAFVPCGHLVCCQRCALRIEREGDKKCPVCMQPFQKSVRIYNS